SARTGIVESDSKVEVVFDETANLRISTSGKDGSDKGYGTNSFLEQWKYSYSDNDDYDPYNDDIDSKVEVVFDETANLRISTSGKDGSDKGDSKVEVVFDETANLRISTSGKDGSDKGYGTNSFLEQWKYSYSDNDDYDPYNDDMYENHDLSEHMQSICDDLDITVYGRNKK
nr:hypothetical protein [Tanacetum cinerariifolium]